MVPHGGGLNPVQLLNHEKKWHCDTSWAVMDSSVGIATRYGMDGPGIESRWGATFSAPVQTGPGAHAASCAMGTGSFPGVKRPGRGFDHPPPSSAEVKEKVNLYLYTSNGKRFS